MELWLAFDVKLAKPTQVKIVGALEYIFKLVESIATHLDSGCSAAPASVDETILQAAQLHQRWINYYKEVVVASTAFSISRDDGGEGGETRLYFSKLLKMLMANMTWKHFQQMQTAEAAAVAKKELYYRWLLAHTALHVIAATELLTHAASDDYARMISKEEEVAEEKRYAIVF